MKRRTFIAALGGATVWSRLAGGQTKSKPRLIGLLSGQTAAGTAADISAFLDGLRDLGYVENKDFQVVYRYGEGHYDRMPLLAQELMQLKPDLVLAAGGSPAALAIQTISATVPIVSPTLYAEIELGLAESDAHPGGNVTGLSVILPGLIQKQLELAHDMLPTIQRFGLLTNPATHLMMLEHEEVDSAAPKLGISIVWVEVRRPEELNSAFEKCSSEKCQAIIIAPDGMFLSARRQLASLAAAARLPDIYAYREHVDAGGMISYGVDIRDNFRRAASYVDKIWKDTPPGELPIEFPTKLELLVNLKTSKALGIEIPPTLLARADEVIE